MSDRKGGRTLGIILAVLLAAYLASGIYSIESGQHALVLRFGKVIRKSTLPGINYRLPLPFERVIKVRVMQVKKVLLQSRRGGGTENFTGDENMIMVRAVVNYDVKDPEAYLFNVDSSAAVIESAARMCLSAELAELTVDNVMTTGKSILRLVLKAKIQRELDELGVGVRVISVELTDIAPPLNVSKAFKAVSDAREKKQRIIKEAEGYANTVIPRGRGESASIISQAGAYADETLKKAQAQVKAFNALYAEYVREPDITLKLRYLETLRKIYNRCQIMIDADPTQSIYYIGKDLGKKGESEKNDGQIRGGGG